MPIPLIWIIPLITVLTTAILTVTFWEKIVIFFKGKRLAILGAKSTGKTTLYNFLTNGQLKGGTGIEETKANNFKLEDLNFHIKAGLDITGSEDFVNVWEDIIKNSDYTFYMVDSSRVFNSEIPYIQLIEKQLSLIGELYKTAKREDKVNIVCVFSDKVDGFINNKEEFEKSVKSSLRQAFNHVDCYIFVGSLKTRNYRRELVMTMLQTIQAKGKTKN